MRALISGTLVAFAFSITAAAQDNTVTSRTKVSGDAHAVTMHGCLQQMADSSGFVLVGTITGAGDDLKTKSKVKTDVDKDDTTVKSTSATKVDKDDHAIATAGAATTYAVMGREGVDLAAHAGEEVEISAVIIDARRGGDKDADLKIKDRTKIDRDDAPDSKVQSKTKAEVARGPVPQLMAISVRSLGRGCSTR